ncbi:MAG: tetratricopeptide repeat protein [Candidatus Riflebacteria bacterium]|nr:tetratricopeptide repeat protein [Candidatus Riflebacteria bacterium]
MQTRLLKLILLLVLVMTAGTVFAQPFDLLSPGEDSPDTLSHELRALQTIERDLAIEKLTREPTRFEAFIELGELRLSQGKLQEAQRFFEMALEMQPKNLQANEGLVMVHYHKGEFNLARNRMDVIHKFYPLSDQLKEDLDKFRLNLQNQAQLGLTVREDDRGLRDIVTSIEGIFPSNQMPKLTGRYRYERWTNEDNGQRENTQVYSGTLDYKADRNTSLSATWAPEVFSDGESVAGYNIMMVTGTDNLKTAFRGGKATFKENLFTVRNHYNEEYKSFSLFGDLHQRTRVIQTITLADISDGNSRRRWDSELIHSIFRRAAPFLTANLRVYQASYEKQRRTDGNLLDYWAPSDFKGAELMLAWERQVGANWWWGLDTSLTKNSYRFGTDEDVYDSGAGATVHLSYKFTAGSLYVSLGDRLSNYFRERRLEAYGSISF